MCPECKNLLQVCERIMDTVARRAPLQQVRFLHDASDNRIVNFVDLENWCHQLILPLLERYRTTARVFTFQADGGVSHDAVMPPRVLRFWCTPHLAQGLEALKCRAEQKALAFGGTPRLPTEGSRLPSADSLRISGYKSQTDYMHSDALIVEQMNKALPLVHDPDCLFSLSYTGPEFFFLANVGCLPVNTWPFTCSTPASLIAHLYGGVAETDPLQMIVGATG